MEALRTPQVEILRGPSTLVYGIGGIVNVVSNRIPEYVPETLKSIIDVGFGEVSEERTGAFDTVGRLGDSALHVDGASYNTYDHEIPHKAANNLETLLCRITS